MGVSQDRSTWYPQIIHSDPFIAVNQPLLGLPIFRNHHIVRKKRDTSTANPCAAHGVQVQEFDPDVVAGERPPAMEWYIPIPRSKGFHRFPTVGELGPN